jgi:hypothetical protein
MIIFHTIITTKKTKCDYVEGESVTQEDIDIVDAEIIQELEDVYDDDVEYDYDEMEEEEEI